MYFFLAAAPKLIVFRYLCVKGRLLSHKPLLPPPPPGSSRSRCKAPSASGSAAWLLGEAGRRSRAAPGAGSAWGAFVFCQQQFRGACAGGSPSVALPHVRTADDRVPTTHLALSAPWSGSEILSGKIGLSNVPSGCNQALFKGRRQRGYKEKEE